VICKFHDAGIEKWQPCFDELSVFRAVANHEYLVGRTIDLIEPKIAGQRSARIGGTPIPASWRPQFLPVKPSQVPSNCTRDESVGSHL
jgi:hypothetical protein